MYIQMNYTFRWSTEKSERLKRTRGVSLEEIIQADLVADKEHPGRADQRMLLFRLGDYVWVVPYVTRAEEKFLKTAYPSRKYTKMWRLGALS